MSTPEQPEPIALLPAPVDPAPAKTPFWRQPVLLLAAIAVGLLGWQWLESRAHLANVQEELAKRLAESDTVAKESRAIARQAQETLLALQAKVGALDARLAETQGQQLALESMYQELSRSRDERLLAEVEQSVSIAAQQLQLAGNVEAALIALSGAESRLARAAQPQFIGLRKLIVRDVDRLKALPTADVPGLAAKLEGVIATVDGLPLAYEQRPAGEAQAPAEPVPSPKELGFWQALAKDIWRETRQLVRIERVDTAGADPALLSPSQSLFLRENLKLRLINARLGLLARDSRSFREDIRQSVIWLERYFDRRAKPVATAVASLKDLADMDVGVEMPSLNETLDTLRNFKLAKEKR